MVSYSLNPKRALALAPVYMKFLESITCTRPKPVEHGYVFSMATGPFFVRGRTVDSEGRGGGGSFPG